MEMLPLFKEALRTSLNGISVDVNCAVQFLDTEVFISSLISGN